MVYIKNLIFIGSFVLLNFLNKSNCNSYYKIEKKFYNSWQIQVYVNRHGAGSVSIFKTPILDYYVLYNLYVKPEFRNQGLGKSLIKSSQDILLKRNARKIFIQPGPYELDKSLIESEKKEALNKIIKLYSDCGFKFVSKILSKTAYFLYLILGIEEDSNYLMEYK